MFLYPNNLNNMLPYKSKVLLKVFLLKIYKKILGETLLKALLLLVAGVSKHV